MKPMELLHKSSNIKSTFVLQMGSVLLEFGGHTVHQRGFNNTLKNEECGKVTIRYESVILIEIDELNAVI